MTSLTKHFPQRQDKKTPPGGEEEQARHYEALLRVVQQNSDWFHGVFWWNWVSDGTMRRCFTLCLCFACRFY